MDRKLDHVRKCNKSAPRISGVHSVSGSCGARELVSDSRVRDRPGRRSTPQVCRQWPR